MKKSISAILVAALMLFAFTACEQQMPNLYGYVVSDASIRQVGDFVTGQTFDPTKFAVDVVYENGEKDTIEGTNIVTSANKTAYNGDKIQAVFMSDKGATFTKYATLVAYNIDSLTITGPENIELNDVVTNELFTVVANYRTADGSAKQLTLGPTDYTIAVNGTSATAGEIGLTFSVKFANGGESPVADASSCVYTLDVVDPDAEEPEMTFVRLDAVVNEETAAHPYVTRALFDPSMITVYAVYTDGTNTESVDVTADAKIELADASKLTGITGLTGDVRFGTGTTATVNVSYTYVKDDVTLELGSDTTTATIPLRADYATQITAKKTVDEAYAAGASVKAGDFTVTVSSWKSGIQTAIANYATSSYVSLPSGTTVTADVSTAPSRDQAGTFPVELSYTQVYEDQDASYTVTCNVNAKV